jgi:hypothetical protein
MAKRNVGRKWSVELAEYDVNGLFNKVSDIVS